jgi:hypothetical protein
MNDKDKLIVYFLIMYLVFVGLFKILGFIYGIINRSNINNTESKHDYEKPFFITLITVLILDIICILLYVGIVYLNFYILLGLLLGVILSLLIYKKVGIPLSRIMISNIYFTTSKLMNGEFKDKYINIASFSITLVTIFNNIALISAGIIYYLF